MIKMLMEERMKWLQQLCFIHFQWPYKITVNPRGKVANEGMLPADASFENQT
jgi:hypothetical protein